MKLSPIFLLLLLFQLSCENKKPENTPPGIGDSISAEKSIERFLRTETDTTPTDKYHPEIKTIHTVIDSLEFRNLSCVAYKVEITYSHKMHIDYAVPDGAIYYVLRDMNNNNRFYPFHFSKWDGFHSKLSIDEAYILFNTRFQTPVKPFMGDLQNIEAFLNLSGNRWKDLKIIDIDPIFSDLLKLKKISNENEIDSLLNLVKTNYAYGSIKSKELKNLERAMLQAFKFPDQSQLYMLDEGILFVNIYSHGYKNLTVVRIQ